MNINELLDEYAQSALAYGGALDEGYKVAEAWERSEAARAAVDAEVKRMQDRIVDLEREIAYVKNSPAF